MKRFWFLFSLMLIPLLFLGCRETEYTPPSEIEWAEMMERGLENVYNNDREMRKTVDQNWLRIREMEAEELRKIATGNITFEIYGENVTVIIHSQNYTIIKESPDAD